MENNKKEQIKRRTINTITFHDIIAYPDDVPDIEKYWGMYQETEKEDVRSFYQGLLSFEEWWKKQKTMYGRSRKVLAVYEDGYVDTAVYHVHEHVPGFWAIAEHGNVIGWYSMPDRSKNHAV